MEIILTSTLLGILLASLFLKARSNSLKRKKVVKQILQGLGQNFHDFGPFFCCCLSQDPLELTFESDLAMDEVLTEIGCLSRKNQYEYFHKSYGFEYSTFYLVGHGVRIRFELECNFKRPKPRKPLFTLRPQ